MSKVKFTEHRTFVADHVHVFFSDALAAQFNWSGKGNAASNEKDAPVKLKACNYLMFHVTIKLMEINSPYCYASVSKGNFAKPLKFCVICVFSNTVICVFSNKPVYLHSCIDPLSLSLAYVYQKSS